LYGVGDCAWRWEGGGREGWGLWDLNIWISVFVRCREYDNEYYISLPCVEGERESDIMREGYVFMHCHLNLLLVRMWSKVKLEFVDTILNRRREKCAEKRISLPFLPVIWWRFQLWTHNRVPHLSMSHMLWNIQTSISLSLESSRILTATGDRQTNVKKHQFLTSKQEARLSKMLSCKTQEQGPTRVLSPQMA